MKVWDERERAAGARPNPLGQPESKCEGGQSGGDPVGGGLEGTGSVSGPGTALVTPAALPPCPLHLVPGVTTYDR